MKREMKKGTVEFNFFRDFWNLCQAYWIAETTDEFWISLIKDVDKLYMEYREDIPHAKEIIMAFVSSLDNQQREESGKPRITVKCFYDGEEIFK